MFQRPAGLESNHPEWTRGFRRGKYFVIDTKTKTYWVPLVEELRASFGLVHIAAGHYLTGFALEALLQLR